MSKRKIYYLLILVMLLNAVVVYADGTINEDKKKLEETNNKIEELQDGLQENKNETNKVSQEIKSLDLQVDKARNELAEVEQELEKTNNNIEGTIAQLEESENNISLKNDTLNSRLRVMYKSGPLGYAQVLLGSENFTDFLTRLDMFKRIVNQDVGLLKYMKEQRDSIEEKKAKLENQKMLLASTKKDAEAKRNKLELATRQRETRKAELLKDRKEMEKQEDNLNKLAKEIEAEIARKLSAEQYAGGEMKWPTPGYYRITSPFGNRIHPIFHTPKFHTGIDIGAPYGAKVVAANTGVVQFAGWLGGYGKAVIIDHGGKISTLYAHNSTLLVKKGDPVTRGQAISKIGSTGYSTGAHLHFEVRKNGAYTDPKPWVMKK